MPQPLHERDVPSQLLIASIVLPVDLCSFLVLSGFIRLLRLVNIDLPELKSDSLSALE